MILIADTSSPEFFFSPPIRLDCREILNNYSAFNLGFLSPGQVLRAFLQADRLLAAAYMTRYYSLRLLADETRPDCAVQDGNYNPNIDFGRNDWVAQTADLPLSACSRPWKIPPKALVVKCRPRGSATG